MNFFPYDNWPLRTEQKALYLGIGAIIGAGIMYWFNQTDSTCFFSEAKERAGKGEKPGEPTTDQQPADTV